MSRSRVRATSPAPKKQPLRISQGIFYSVTFSAVVLVSVFTVLSVVVSVAVVVSVVVSGSVVVVVVVVVVSPGAFSTRIIA